MKPLLSICIPTYNRCEYLKKSIDSIVRQKEFIDKKVEVVISDNASADNTEVLCSDYTKKFDNFKYFKNSVNVMDRNFPLSLRRANGVFRKLSNDTLIYHKDSLSKLCHFIETHIEDRRQIFFLNRMSKSVTDEVVVCDSLNSFMSKSSYLSTWLGGFGIWEEDCDEITSDTDDCDIKLWQTSKLLQLVARDGGAIIYNIPITCIQEVMGKNVSYGIYKVFYVNFLPIVKRYRENESLSPEVFDALRKNLLYDFFTDFIITWENMRNKISFSEEENLKMLVFNEYINEPYWTDYEKYYKKRKTAVIFKNKIKNVLKKLHLWNMLVDLQIKYQDRMYRGEQVG